MKYKFIDLVDIAELQELTDELFKASSIPSAIVDMDGEVLTGSGWQKICTDFHRKNPETLKDCVKSDTKIREGLNKGDNFVMYKCPRGLTDASSPIIIKGKHIANVFSGQIFLDAPDEACELQFREQAKKLGFDEDEYIKAFREVPVISEKEFKSGLLFLSKLAQMIANMGLKKLNELELSKKRLTELKQTEEIIQHSKNYYRSIISSLHENIMVIERDYKISDVNESFLASTKYKLEDVLLHYCHEISFGYDKPCSECGKECKLPEVFETGVPAHSYHEHVSPDGTKTFMDILYSPIKDESGKVLRVVEAARDISDIVKNREKLEKSESQYKQLAENTETILWEYDIASDRWLYVAPQVERILGYKPEEWTNLEFWSNCLHEDDRDWATKYCAECVRRGEAHEFEYRFIKKTGDIVWLKDVVSVEMQDGMAVKLRGFMLDISKRKLADDKLKEREKHFRALIENISDVIAILDENGNLLYDSPSSTSVLGYQAGELFGKNIFSFVHPDDQERIMQQFAELLQKPDSATPIYFRFLHQDGSWLDIEGTGKNSLNTPEVNGIVINYRDVTERKLAEAQFKGLFETMPSGVAIYEAVDNGSDFVFKLFNRSGEKLESVKREDIIGKKVTEVFPGVEEFGLLDVFKRVFKSGKTENHPVSLYKDNRLVAWRENHVFKLPSDEIVAIYKDVTAEKQTQMALQKSEEQLVQAQHIAQIGDFTWDIVTGVTTWSDGMYRLLKYSKDEIIDIEKVNANIHHPNDLQRVTKWLADGIKSGNKTLPTNEYRLVCKDSEVITVQTDGRFEHDNGKAVRLFGTCQDISKRKLTEDEAKKFRTISDKAVHGSAIVDPAGNLVYINDYFAEVHGYKADELLGKTLAVFHNQSQLEAVNKINEALKKEGSYQSKEVWHVHKDGTEFPMLMSGIFILSDDGTPEYIAATAIDITDLKLAKAEKDKLEAQLQQAQKMESIGRLAGGVAHDFNNLLTGITGNIQLAQMDIATNDPLYETLDEVNAAAKRAADLTRQLLAFSRKQIIKPKIINLNNLINNMHKMLIRIIGEDVDLQTIPMKLLGQIKADPGQVEQIIVNLSVNARDAMPDGGKLTIETGNVTLDDEYCRKHVHAIQGNYIMLAISDDGEGMDQGTRKNIFEPFFTTKEQGKGTGLGLSTVYGIVKQHNGYVEVYSEAGEGTSFKVYFPRVNKKADKITKTSVADDLPTGTETVFVVEDEAVVRNIAVKILKRQGYKVFEAEDGSNALEIIKNQTLSIDLLLTDVVMPKMNGRQLAEKLQEIYPNLKILYTSGYTENVIAHHGMIDDGLEFIGKPYTPQALAIRVRKLLDEK